MIRRKMLFSCMTSLFFCVSIDAGKEQYVLFPFESFSNFMQFQSDIPGYIKKLATGWCAQFHKETVQSIRSQTAWPWPLSLIAIHKMEQNTKMIHLSSSEYASLAGLSLAVAVVSFFILHKQK